MKNENCIDSGLGFFWAAVPAQPENRLNMSEIKSKVGCLIIEHERAHGMTSESYFTNKAYKFYYSRLRNIPMYGLVQGRELVKMICRCAFNDSTLTDNESIVIMETCLDPQLDNILLEVNYNACW